MTRVIFHTGGCKRFVYEHKDLDKRLADTPSTKEFKEDLRKWTKQQQTKI